MIYSQTDFQKLAFEDCVKDAVCAGETVRGYMSKFAQDCNKDGWVISDEFIVT